MYTIQKGFPPGSVVKNPPATAGDASSIPGSGRCPGGENGNFTPIFLPGKVHGQRSLVGYSPWGGRMGHDWATEHTHTKPYLEQLSLSLGAGGAMLTGGHLPSLPPGELGLNPEGNL